MTITVHINDALTLMPPDMTVAALIAERYGDRRWLAVAVDGQVVPRTRWAEHLLYDGAAVQVLTAVQGG